MEQFREAYMADVQSRISGAKTSMLAMAAPLESSSSTSKAKPTAPAADTKKTPEPKALQNQKGGLLIALLAVGALRPAIVILSKFPWLVDAQLEIADLIIRIMKVSIAPLYDSLLVTKERNAGFTQPRAKWSAGGVAAPAPRKPLLTLWAPPPPCTSATDFVFFFPEWTDQIPICTSLDDLKDVIDPFMRLIGLHISRDPLLLTKFLRLGRMQIVSTVTGISSTRLTSVLKCFRFPQILSPRNL